jgi:transcription elongation factor Elf1
MPLTPEQQRQMSRSIAAWRADLDVPVACPVCGKAELVIIDRSARPHAEWYALACPACGLSETLHIPLGARVPTLD